MANPVEKEMHEYIDGLSEREYYGNVTFYFKKGGIEGVRETEHICENEKIIRDIGKNDIITRLRRKTVEGKRAAVYLRK